MDQRFPSALRLRRGEEFRNVFDQGRSVADGTLVVYAMINELPYARLGLSVSRKVGNAVRRNRWKRLIREAFRLRRESIPAGIDLIVIPRSGQPTLDRVQQSLVSLARQAQRRVKKSKSSGQKSEVKNQESEVRGQRSEYENKREPSEGNTPREKVPGEDGA